MKAYVTILAAGLALAACSSGAKNEAAAENAIAPGTVTEADPSASEDFEALPSESVDQAQAEADQAEAAASSGEDASSSEGSDAAK